MEKEKRKELEKQLHSAIVQLLRKTNEASARKVGSLVKESSKLIAKKFAKAIEKKKVKAIAKKATKKGIAKTIVVARAKKNKKTK